MKTEFPKGRFISNQIDDLKIHTYISPEESFEVTSHILETKDKLIVIDAQFFLPCANEVLQFIYDLNKPVDCVIITHAHPDHWLGVELFEQFPIISSLEVANEIDQIGEGLIKQVRNFHGELVTTKKVVPKALIKEGEQQMAGLIVDVRFVKMAEGTNHVLIKIPEYKLFVAQDLAYNKVHLFLGDNYHDNWLSEIKKLSDFKDYLFLSGHGEPSSVEIFSEMETYIAFVQKLIKSGANSEEIIKQLCEKFSDYKSSNLIAISNDYLFNGSHG